MHAFRIPFGFISASFATFVILSPASTPAAVPAADITLKPVITQNLPVLASLLAYGSSEAGATAPHKQIPLFTPYDSLQETWWDNLVAEQLQERVPVVMLETTGSKTTNPADFAYCPGGLYGSNPVKLGRYIRALQRAGATDQIKLACFYQGAADSIYQNYYGVSTHLDFANPDVWDKIWWQRIIKPWFDTVPSQYWYTIGGKVLVEFWGLGAPAINQQGNLSLMLNSLATKFQTTYGVTPVFIMGGVSNDTTLQGNAYLYGDNAWFSTPSHPYSLTPLYGTGNVIGCVIPGVTDPNYYTVGSPSYMNPNQIIPRNGIGGTGALGDTFITGLNAIAAGNPVFTTIEGYMDYAESIGIYRSNDASWSFPNQYLNLVARYTDLRTVTLRLEAEGCDEYADTTSGNSGGAFLRSGEDLDVRALAGPPAISSNGVNYNGTPSLVFDGDLTNKYLTSSIPSVSAPVWLQYDYGSGNTETVNKYYLTSAGDAQPRDPKDWTIQGSNDGSTWTIVDTRTGQVFANRAQTNTYTFANANGYRFYRMNVTASAGGGTNSLQLSDLMFVSAYSAGGGWAVTNTAASEWIQFDQVNLSTGNYKFPVRYSSTASHTARLLIDGVALPDVVLPSTGGAFTTAYLGAKAISHGTHNLRVFFVDGGVDVDWLFVRKYDPMMSFQSLLNGHYLSASLGGNNPATATSINCNPTAVGLYEQFSMDDLSGAGTVSSGDTVMPQVYNGCYLTAKNAGNSGFVTTYRRPLGWETYTIVKVSGSGAIAAGDQVALKTSGGYYLTVKSDGSVDATGTSIGTAQTLTVGIAAQ